MTFTDGLHDGLAILTYAAGFSWALVIVALLLAAGWYSSDWVAHRARVAKLRRQVRRSGRPSSFGPNPDGWTD